MADLEAAYASAVYRIEQDPPVSFVFASPAHAAVSARAIGFPTGWWTIVTADNPGRCTLSPEANSRRRVELRDWIESRGLSHTPTESHDQRGGHRERGFLVRGMDRTIALDAWCRFDQHAVVLGHGAKCGLLFPHTERWIVMPTRDFPSQRCLG